MKWGHLDHSDISRICLKGTSVPIVETCQGLLKQMNKETTPKWSK